MSTARSKAPRLITLERGRRLYRIHRAGHDALWFGPGAAVPPTFRFDDPDGEYGVCYAGTTVEAAFAETFLRDPPVAVVSRAVLESRRLASIELRRDLKVAALFGPGLAAAGVTAHLTTGPYEESRAWSRRIWTHDARVAGVAYASKHDNHELCVALFDRCRAALRVIADDGMLDDVQRLGALLDRYDVALIA